MTIKLDHLPELIEELEARDLELYGELMAHTSPIRRAITFLQGVNDFVNSTLDEYKTEIRELNETLQFMDDQLNRMQEAHDKERLARLEAEEVLRASRSEKKDA